ncbi:MAG: sulfatase-like hydrolase/transferase [Candidatus Omnitrophica bacterium]|nr:sulfatase-like hydrolase/transferase [Candidatus Omnitrophota bacterium]
MPSGGAPIIRYLTSLRFFVACLLLVEAISGVHAENVSSHPDKPNILLLLADDQGWGDMGCAGHPVLKTPGLDKLASEGCRLTTFYTSAPVCSPSRAGILTGRDQNRFGMKHIINDGEDKSIPVFHHVPVNEPTIPRLLKSVGYKTAHIGKWHLSFSGRKDEPTPHDYGFDHYLLLAAGRHTSYKDSKWQRDGERIQTEGRWTAEVYVDEAIDFIESCTDAPFFVNLWSFAPHIAVECAGKYKEMYPGRTEQEQTYFGCITQMDEQYGRLLDYLEEKGLTDNTIVVFTSDNGCTSPILPWVENARGYAGPFRGSKHNIHEAGIRVPALVRWPGVTQPGSVSNEIASTLDLLPTLCSAAGVDLPDEWDFDGGLLNPAFENRPIDRPHPVYIQYELGRMLLDRGEIFTSPPLALRKNYWKLFCDTDFKNLELYNMDTDPGEKWNMADIHPDIAQDLLNDLEEIYPIINGPYSKTAETLNPNF